MEGEGEDEGEPGDVECQPCEEEDRGAAKTKWKKMLDPKLPSQAEIDFHMMTHLPYRNWCEHCVKGRAKEMSHQTIAKKDKPETIEFHMDFYFPGEEDGTGALTILVIRERQTRMTMASAVPSKSMGNFIVRRGISFMKELGCSDGTIIMKSDQEPAMKAIIEGMVKFRASEGISLEIVDKGIESRRLRSRIRGVL